jgi:hypothetical protein
MEFISGGGLEDVPIGISGIVDVIRDVRLIVFILLY